MKWGGISSKELDEAVMLESALFHENSQGASHSGPDRISGPNHQHVHHPQSPSLAARQMLREQQVCFLSDVICTDTILHQLIGQVLSAG